MEFLNGWIFADGNRIKICVKLGCSSYHHGGSLRSGKQGKTRGHDGHDHHEPKSPR